MNADQIFLGNGSGDSGTLDGVITIDGPDIYFGDYLGGTGMKWNQGSALFDIKGDLSAGTIDIGNGDFTVSDIGKLDCTGGILRGTTTVSKLSSVTAEGTGTLEGNVLTLNKLNADYSYVLSDTLRSSLWCTEESFTSSSNTRGQIASALNNALTNIPLNQRILINGHKIDNNFSDHSIYTSISKAPTGISVFGSRGNDFFLFNDNTPIGSTIDYYFVLPSRYV
jgi:hypothetical protein